MSYYMFPQGDEVANYAWRLRDMKHRFKTDKDSYYYKLVDNETGTIVAYALWQVPTPAGSVEEEGREEEERKQAEEKHKKDERLPEGTNVPLMEDFNAETDKMRKKYVDRSQDYSKHEPSLLSSQALTPSLQVLKAIATLPEYQGRGCGSQLLRHGLVAVDAQGARAWLEATPQGRRVYMEHGWRDVDAMVFDLQKYGYKGAGVQVTTCMVRDSRRVI